MVKKAGAVLLTLLILFSVLSCFSGCGTNKRDNASSPGIENPQSAASPESSDPTGNPGIPGSDAGSRIPSEGTLPSDDDTDEASDNTSGKDKNIVTSEDFTALSSPELKGRVFGSAAGKKAQSMLEDLFGDIGLSPFENQSENQFKMPVYIDPSVSADTLAKADGYNITGFLEGEDDTECFVITAHFDGVGDGAAAVDNMSGVYTLLKTAEKLTDYSEGHDLDRDVIFSALDGEEYGLVGSSYLAEEIKEKYEEILVINMDCVGIKKSDDYMVIGDRNNIQPFIDSIDNQLEDHGFETVPVEGFWPSDHISFEALGIPAVTIGEKSSKGIIHTSRDTAEQIDTGELERLSDAVSSYVIEQADMFYN